MAYSARVLADSISESGYRLTTMEVTFPRFVLAEFNTHRVFSRNSASSRAIPFAKQIAKIIEDPFIPEYWGANQSGMQAATEIPKKEQIKAKQAWLKARDVAIELASGLAELPVHKQTVNRLIEPFMWHTVLVTSSEWSNFYALRTDENAQPEIRKAAQLMQDVQETSEPKLLKDGQWHLPLIQDDERDGKFETTERARLISVGRCARVSYLTHDGVRDPQKDVELAEMLRGNGHMSPFEHVARPMTAKELETGEWSGNFRGWHQYRKDLPNEDDFAKTLSKSV